MGNKKMILVINCGSSSIKYKLFCSIDFSLLAKGNIEKIGEKGVVIKNHHQGVKEVFTRLLSEKVVSSLSEISVIGHRVVHGGEKFRAPQVITSSVIKQIESCVKLAPLHNPVNLEGIIACKKILPKVVQVAVFDTAFHQTMPEHVYSYAIPRKFYYRYGVRKYGFHGTSHQYVTYETAKILKKPVNNLNIVSCHLGNGCSIVAIKNGESVDSSMGFTPLSGVMMGTRCGDIDVGAVFHLIRKAKLSLDEMDVVLNRKSGLVGVSGVSNDMRVLLEKENKDKNVKLALDMFKYRILRYIGAYFFALGKVDAICFTAGIGENNPKLVDWFKEKIYAAVSKKVKVLVVPTNEELMIAKLSAKFIK